MVSGAASIPPSSLEAGHEPTPSRNMDWESFFRNYRAPDFIPGYQILNKLGSGVFGEVYKAKKTSIGKLYAIKFLRIQDEGLGEQIMRELGSIDHFAQVDHPNLVSIEDRGEAGGIPFIVMGYAGDETLKVLLRAGPVSLERTAVLFRQILRGVQALHEHAIVHFDLKPANIFIRGDVARVGDYGLSRLMSESRATLSMGRGTPHYMAPEMLQRRGDARSDVYSLGVMLFEMLTGDVPFSGGSEWEILKRHESEMPKLPASVPAALRGVVLKCLAKRPEDRYVHAGALIEAFEAALSSAFRAGNGAAIKVGHRADHGAGINSGNGFGGDGRSPQFPDVAAGAPQKAGVHVGAQVGRWAAKGRLTIDKVRLEVQDLLVKVRAQTRDAVVAARNHYQEGLKAPPPPPSLLAPSALGPPLIPPPLPRNHRRRRPVRSFFRLLGRLLTLPFRFAAWAFANLLAVVLIGGIIAGAGVLIHLGLRAAIL